MTNKIGQYQYSMSKVKPIEHVKVEYARLTNDAYSTLNAVLIVLTFDILYLYARDMFWP